MIKEVVESVKLNIGERFSSPVLGSYTIAAIFCNWKSIVVLFTSEAKGISLTKEVVDVFPGLYPSLIYPLVFSISFSIIYPSLKALISSLGSYARLLELKTESKLDDFKELQSETRKNRKNNDIDFLIKTISDLSMDEKIGYHDLKRIMDVLPDEEDLRVKKSKAEGN